MSEDLFEDEKDLFGEEPSEIDDLFPNFNPPTQVKKEHTDEKSKESQAQER